MTTIAMNHRVDLDALTVVFTDAHGEDHDLNAHGSPCQTLADLAGFVRYLHDRGAYSVATRDALLATIVAPEHANLFEHAVNVCRRHHIRDPSIRSIISWRPWGVELDLHTEGTLEWVPVQARAGKVRDNDGGRYTVHRWTDERGLEITVFRAAGA